MVMRVSNFRRSIFERFWVVTSISSFSISRNFWSTFPMIFLSCRALASAISASLVQMNWIPKIPTFRKRERLGIIIPLTTLLDHPPQCIVYHSPIHL